MGKKKNISPEKIKDMIRSILPSTARVSARWAKATASREVRRRVRMTLHNEDAEETKADLHEEAFQSPNVWSRRGADKLNHFMRWCESWTRGMTDQQALDAVRAVLPRNLIGDHAYFHWEARIRYRRRRPIRHVQSRERLEQSRYDKTRHRLRQALSVDPGFQRDLNAAIKARKPEGEPRRMFHGQHDIDAFVRDVHDLAAFVCEWRVLLDLLHEVEQHRPHFLATPSFCLIAPM